MFRKFLVVTFIVTWATNFVEPQKNVGDTCVDEHTNSLGVCTKSEDCISAKKNYDKSGLPPSFCQYTTWGPNLVCCRDGNTILQTPRPRTSDPLPVWNSANDRRRISEKKCDAYARHVQQKVDVSPLLLGEDDGISVAASKCHYTSVELIIGGEDANRGEFPHMAAIGWANYDSGYDFNCGGSLVSARFVVTAGHCALDPRARIPAPSVVRLGDQNIDNSVNDNASPIDVPIRNVIKHPEYRPPNRYNDIALIELASEVEFEDAIRPACLWTRDDFGGNNIAIATGWGVFDTVTRKTSKELQKVSLSLLSNEYCDPMLEYLQNRHWKGFKPTQMCAGELRGGKDTCQGDSGSPLQVTSKENHCIFYVLGVTSFGKKCAQAGLPGIYTRISEYLDWIEGVVWPGEF